MQLSFIEATLSFLVLGVSEILIVRYFQCGFGHLLRRWSLLQDQSLLQAQCDSMKQIHLYVCLKRMNREGNLSQYLFLFVCFVRDD